MTAVAGKESTHDLDIVIPVYQEGENILRVLASLQRSVTTSFRVLICYDKEEDNTLEALRRDPPDCEILLVRNGGKGALGAVLSGFRKSSAPAVLVIPADDDYNAPRVDVMVALLRDGFDIVAASRFMKGGCMEGCRWLKATLVRTSAFALHRVARVPTHDPSNGFRLFSRRVIDSIPVESTEGFAYSLELLVKAHRLGWRICEVPALWYERNQGTSRFRILGWLPQYLHWFGYAFATTFAGRGPKTVRMRNPETRPS